jgi:hypothetical protein
MAILKKYVNWICFLSLCFGSFLLKAIPPVQQGEFTLFGISGFSLLITMYLVSLLCRSEVVKRSATAKILLSALFIAGTYFSFSYFLNTKATYTFYHELSDKDYIKGEELTDQAQNWIAQNPDCNSAPCLYNNFQSSAKIWTASSLKVANNNLILSFLLLFTCLGATLFYLASFMEGKKTPASITPSRPGMQQRCQSTSTNL